VHETNLLRCVNEWRDWLNVFCVRSGLSSFLFPSDMRIRILLLKAQTPYRSLVNTRYKSFDRIRLNSTASTSTKKVPSAHIAFYISYGRSMIKILIIAGITYQIVKLVGGMDEEDVEGG